MEDTDHKATMEGPQQLPPLRGAIPSLLAPKAFYFFYYAALAALSPFLVLYYQQLGFTGRQIGVLMAVPPLVSLVGSPLWSGLADATQRHRRVVALAIFGTLGAVGAISRITTFYGLLAAVGFYAFFMAPIIPLMDNAVLELLGDRRHEYGKQRLWGAVGYGVSAAAVGMATEHAGLAWAFYSYLILMALGLLPVSRLPIGQGELGRSFWNGLKGLMANRAWAMLLGTVFALGVCASVVRSYLFLHLGSMHASRGLMGLSLTFATVGELPVFFFAHRMLARRGPRGLLTFSILTLSVQAALLSVMPAPWLVLPIQLLLNGPSFSAQLTAQIAYAKEIAPPGMGATAQGILAAVSSGLASSCGAVVGGLLYDSVGTVGAFRWAGAGALTTLAFFLLVGRWRINPGGGGAKQSRRGRG